MHTEKLYKELFLPILLILLLVGCFAVTIQILWKKSLQECYAEIEKNTSQEVATLKYNIELYQNSLDFLSSLIAYDGFEDINILKNKLNSFCQHEQIDALCIQFPDNVKITAGQDTPDYQALPPFEQSLQNLPRISGRLKSTAGDNQWYLYFATPIKQHDKVLGIIYGFIDVERLNSFFEHNLPYGGKAQVYIVDGDTGDFLMDMWHPTLGNMLDGSMGTRVTKDGYSLDKFQDDLRKGKPGYFVFISKTVGEYFYTYYQPTGINNWTLSLTVLESIAFADTKETSDLILLLGSAVSIVIILYLIFTFKQFRNRLRAQQKQIQKTTFMFDVQKTLFNVYQKPALMSEALCKVGQAIHAEGVLLLTMQDSKVRHVTIWRDKDAQFETVSQGKDLKQDFPQVHKLLLQNQSALFYRGKQDLHFSKQEQSLINARKVYSMMLTPVLDINGILWGVLCALNFKKADLAFEYIEGVAHSFMMAMCNMESYKLIHDMGTIDALTSMKNRNSYEQALPAYAKEAHPDLHCIYIDVNGLHELNNQQGHAAGDTMLRFVAQHICAIFSPEHSYRIGGDEFVTFAYANDDEIKHNLNELCQQVEAANYHISVGSAGWSESTHNLNDLIIEAETAMYADKKAFYAQNDRRQAR